MMKMYKEHVLLGSLVNIRNEDLMNDPRALRRLVRTVATKSGAKVYGTHVKTYPERGINATADIGESVVVIQVSPERHYVAILVHYTYENVNPRAGIGYAVHRLQADPPIISELVGPELPQIIE